MPRQLGGWRALERRFPDGAVESVQSARADEPVVDRSEGGAALLGLRYWHEATRISAGIARPRARTDGVDLCAFGHGPALLSFGLPRLFADDAGLGCIYPITGGLLARRPGGELALEQRDGTLSVSVRGFVPRSKGFLYEQVERRAHVALSRRYIRRLVEGRRR
jgi:hypothetical protein